MLFHPFITSRPGSLICAWFALGSLASLGTPAAQAQPVPPPNVPSPFRLPGGPRSSKESLDVRITTGALVSPDVPWTGERLINADALNQSVTARGMVCSPIAFVVKAHLEGVSDDVVFKAPQLDKGWSVDYFDANNIDITEAITGKGWLHPILPNEDVAIGVEITPPVAAPIGSSREIVLTAITGDRKQTAHETFQDTVKAIAEVRAAGTADVSVKRITWLDASEIKSKFGWVGNNVVGTPQVLSAVTSRGTTERYKVNIKNTSAEPASFTLKLSAPAPGWNLRLYDAQEHAVGTTAPTSWALPVLKPEATTSVILEAQSASNAAQTNTIEVAALSEGQGDKVTIRNPLQWMVGLRWSLDGTKWTDVTDKTLLEVEQFTVVGIQAVKSNPKEDWPELNGEPTLGPNWTWENGEFEGPDVWLHATQITPQFNIATATFGTTFSLKIKVKEGDATIHYDTE